MHTTPHDTAENFSGLFDSIEDSLFVLDAQGNTLYVDQTVVARLGYRARPSDPR
jgi:PAS domain-containing protein